LDKFVTFSPIEDSTQEEQKNQEITGPRAELPVTLISE
jgi:hypothetical protein